MDKLKWKPLFSNGEIKDKMLNHLNLISNDLVMKAEPSAGLLSGTAGESIFWAYYAEMKKKPEYGEKCADLIGSALNSVSTSDIQLSFSVGISGILWAFNHLIEMDIIEADINEMISEEIYTVLNKYSKLHLSKGQYDYLHDGIGPHLFYLSNLSNTHSRQALENSVGALKKSSEKFKEGIAWPMKLMDMKGQRPDTISYNLGLSHGNPSIAIILARMLQSNIKVNDTKKLLEESINWILDKKQAITSSSLFASSYVYKENPVPLHSRLGWCYGDLGIATTIYQAGIITENELWKKEAIEITLHASKRRDLTETAIRDTALCHGSIGVAHVFNRMYQYTGVEEFKEAATYWYLQTLNFFETPQGMKSARYKEQGYEFELVTGLLEGVSGIGLGLMAAISDIEPKWDRLLLLS